MEMHIKIKVITVGTDTDIAETLAVENVYDTFCSMGK